MTDTSNQALQTATWVQSGSDLMKDKEWILVSMVGPTIYS